MASKSKDHILFLCRKLGAYPNAAAYTAEQGRVVRIAYSAKPGEFYTIDLNRRLARLLYERLGRALEA